MSLPMKSMRLSVFVYSLIVNIPVSFFICAAATITGLTNWDSGVLTVNFNNVNWANFFINYAISFTIAMIVGNFVPLTTIGRWFTALFGVKNDTYEGNMKYRLLATLIISLIYFVAISPILTIVNYFWLKIYSSPEQCFISWALSAPLLIIVGFVSSLINDIPAYKAGHKINKDF